MTDQNQSDQPELQLTIIPSGLLPSDAPFTLTAETIAIRDDLTYEEWLEGLRTFKRIKEWAKHKLEMDFSEYLAWGQARFSKDQMLAGLSQLEFEMPIVTRALDINTIPADMRQDSLTSDHYVILARSGLKAAEKKKWSRIAADQSLTPNQLKASIAAGEVVASTVAKSLTHGIISIHGIGMEFQIYLRRLAESQGTEDPVDALLKMETASIHDILKEIEPIAHFYQAARRALATPKKKPARRKAKTSPKTKSRTPNPPKR